MTQYCCTVSHRSSNKTAHIVSLPSKNRLVCFFYGERIINFTCISFPECALIPKSSQVGFRGVPGPLGVCHHARPLLTSLSLFICLIFFHGINFATVEDWCHDILIGVVLGVSNQNKLKRHWIWKMPHLSVHNTQGKNMKKSHLIIKYKLRFRKTSCSSLETLPRCGSAASYILTVTVCSHSIC